MRNSKRDKLLKNFKFLLTKKKRIKNKQQQKLKSSQFYFKFFFYSYLNNCKPLVKFSLKSSQTNETLFSRTFFKNISIKIDLNGNFLNYLDIVLFKCFFQTFLSCLNPKILSSKVEVLFVFF